MIELSSPLPGATELSSLLPAGEELSSPLPGADELCVPGQWIPDLPPVVVARFSGDGILDTAVKPAAQAGFSGAGTLIVPGDPAGVAGFSGAGTLVASTLSSSGLFLGEGTLGAATRPAAAAALAGSGTLGTSAKPSSAASYAGAGTLGAAAVPAPSAAYSGTGTLAISKVSVYEDFTRANATALGARYTQGGVGSGLGITANATSWGNGGTTDGSAWAMHDIVLATDVFYVSATATGASSGWDSRLFAGVTSSFVTGAYLNWFNNAIYFGRFTGSYTSISDMQPVTSGITIANGTLIEFYRALVSGHYTYYVYIAGVQKIAFPDTSDLIAVGSSNRRWGAGQKRGSFTNSGFITDLTGRDN